jgi:hypothetical protein
MKCGRLLFVTINTVAFRFPAGSSRTPPRPPLLSLQLPEDPHAPEREAQRILRADLRVLGLRGFFRFDAA